MTTRRQEPEEADDDPRDLEEREDYIAAHAYHEEEEHQHSDEKTSFVERIGLTPLLGGVAAIITAIAALISAFNSRGGHPPDAPPQASAASSFNVSDYWYGIPANTTQPLIFHILIAESASTQGTPSRPGTVMGTMRNPCQGEAVIRIDSGSWDGNRLNLRVKQTGSGKPLALDVQRTGDDLEGSVVQDTYDGHITLHRGETSCPSR